MKIALLGYGRMGKAIEGFALEKGHEIVLKIGADNTEELTKENLIQADVAIDFSLPSTAYSNIQLCLDASIPVISGTTGWIDKLTDIQAYCSIKGGAFLYASNFSIGVNIFFDVNQKLAQLMDAHSQYDISMEEIHHIHKLDSPSGTGISLANQIIDKVERKTDWEESEQKTEEHVIPIHSKRIDMTPGTHGVRYQSNIDTIEIVHTAHSRDGFAKGALLAAEWIVGKKGNFRMKDVLGI